MTGSVIMFLLPLLGFDFINDDFQYIVKLCGSPIKKELNTYVI